MSKIIVNHEVISSEDKSLLNEIKALKKDNEITYFDNDVKVSLKVLNNRILLTRENDKFKIDLEFEENKNLVTNYVIKDLGLKVKLETKTKKVVINDESIYVYYDLFMNGSFSDSFTYKLEWRCL